jgi:uncharacterized protein (DUF1810 family)
MRRSATLQRQYFGARLIECTKAVLDVPAKTAHELFGAPDDMKFRSSMTLFDAVDAGGLYGQAQNRFFWRRARSSDARRPEPMDSKAKSKWPEDRCRS